MSQGQYKLHVVYVYCQGNRFRKIMKLDAVKSNIKMGVCAQIILF